MFNCNVFAAMYLQVVGFFCYFFLYFQMYLFETVLDPFVAFFLQQGLGCLIAILDYKISWPKVLKKSGQISKNFV